MNRRYTIEEFINIVSKIRKIFKNVCISTDIIVGFKGETDAEFQITKANLERIKFSFIHIFPYSERTGTLACRLNDSVDKAEQKRRGEELKRLNVEFRQSFYHLNEQTKHRVLIEEYIDGYSLGYTENYIYTYIPGEYRVGDIVEVTLDKAFKNGMIAR